MVQSLSDFWRKLAFEFGGWCRRNEIDRGFSRLLAHGREGNARQSRMTAVRSLASLLKKENN
jgi:hypothetical protein